MPDGFAQGPAEHTTRAHAAQPARHADDSPSPVATQAAPLSYPAQLLADQRLSGRGNGAVRTALMLQMQQTYGNRAVQRFLQSSVQRAAASVQRQQAKGTTKVVNPGKSKWVFLKDNKDQAAGMPAAALLATKTKHGDYHSWKLETTEVSLSIEDPDCDVEVFGKFEHSGEPPYEDGKFIGSAGLEALALPEKGATANARVTGAKAAFDEKTKLADLTLDFVVDIKSPGRQKSYRRLMWFVADGQYGSGVNP